jgi:hypothetical protein
MSLQVNSAFITFVSGGAIPIYSRVKLSSGAVVVAVDTDVAYVGVAQNSAAGSGEAVSVRLIKSPGTFFMVAQTAITKDAVVYPATEGKVKATGTTSIGVALEAAGADGNQIEVLPA